MHKKVIVVGNSLAVVIDKPWRAALNIGRNTLLRVSCDGQRLILEPDGKREEHEVMSEDQAVVLHAPAVTRSLIQHFHMDGDHFARLHHAPPMAGIRGVLRYQGWLESTTGSHATPTELATIHRIHLCWEQLRNGGSWDEAIEAALEHVPMV